MPRRQDDPARRSGRPAGSASPALLAGVALVVVATLAVFLTDQARYLRPAVVVAAWAFAGAAFLAARRRTEHLLALAREEDLRRGYARDVERGVAERWAADLEEEAAARAAAEQALRAEIGSLRAGLAALRGLPAEMAGLARLREDMAELTALRSDVAALGSLREDVAALAALRRDLGQLGELRADLGRFRAELLEQLGGRTLAEPVVGPPLQREPAAPPLAAATALHPLMGASPVGDPRAGDPAAGGSDLAPAPTVRSGRRAGDPRRPVPHRRRTDDARSAAPEPAPRFAGDPAGLPEPAGHARLAEILAEGGATPPSGRRRRRHGAEDSDDVLARVLGRD